jgi:hypothetical protein
LLKEGAQPFRQKKINRNPMLAPLIQKELQTMIDVNIIAPIRHSYWVANIVVVWEKNGDIRLCVDFRNLNQISLKDNYPFPNMENMLQRVTGVGMFFVFDGFSGYSHFFVQREDQIMTTFNTLWGTYKHLIIPFSVLKDGSNFQRVVDFSSRDLVRKTI